MSRIFTAVACARMLPAIVLPGQATFPRTPGIGAWTTAASAYVVGVQDAFRPTQEEFSSRLNRFTEVHRNLFEAFTWTC